MTAALLIALGAALVTGVVGFWSSPEAAGPRVIDEVAVTAMHLQAGFSNNSPSIVADPTEDRFVVMGNRLDAPDFGCALQVSGDGGQTWVTVNPVPELPPGAQKCYAPEVAFGPDGTLYYLFVGLQGSGNQPMGAFLVSTSDRAQTFTDPLQVVGPLNFAVRMAVDRTVGPLGRLHLVWLHATSDPPLGGFGPPPNPILAAYSDDGGASFSDPVNVSGARQRVVAPTLALSPDHTVHVAYYDLGDDAVDYQGLEGPVREEPWSLVIARSPDAGRTFGPGQVVDDEIVPTERVMLVFTMPPPALVVGEGERVCAAWADGRYGDADVLARCSTDGGQSWAAARRVNDDTVGNGRSQYLPRLGLSLGGRLDALFLDRRDDPSNARNHVYLTYSIDGGQSFAPNRRISGAPSDSRIGAQYAHASADGQYEMGGRLGLLSEASRAVAAWPDTRHSRPATTGQDLFSAVVDLPEMATDRVLGRALGIGVAAVGVAALAWVTRRGQRRGARVR